MPTRRRGGPEPGGATNAEGERELLSSADLARTVARIAHEILEKTADSGARVVLLGLPTRGVHLANRLAERIRAIGGAGDGGSTTVDVGTLDPTLYRDDLRRQPTRPLAETDIPAAGIDDVTVVLVDDVLMSGRTVRAALDALRDHGRPRAVQLAVLVDRGHRELPIRADYVGKNVPTNRGEDVAVSLVESDGHDGVTLR
ncbi:bifunctional pyr operon transcriptional regulator/uracil phosphoribosyltransferase PyrR [Actinomycetospora sp. TBRC 11914]|uniref:bifunctional pyr operon transcriptional regulator/uracil phosphoribosyltransferase PyrR n=1 Tax=Actinomycetospora sp. TBRC 11914 TaxID=2729387 RepID=UPI00145E3AD0|nr:bifunctional pyr operon transcriptional regulator/uracil phosphoribosyltransferase PyrR [Actinomycetospora sp. TBRC 11914]NMO89646.1 bifunctional pyr operon transcriptional regulator/uracil phosphoribosyltransferase PyrR [Actinomycetospora sp. TBRC 11914]